MQNVPLLQSPLRWEGAISLQSVDGAVQPWRLPHGQLPLFHPKLVDRAGSPSGIRICLRSDTTTLALEVEPHSGVARIWDLFIDGQMTSRVTLAPGETQVSFTGLGGEPARLRRIELYLPAQYVPLRVRSLRVDADAAVESWHDPRPRWVVYGSSIEHAQQAHGPSQTWPAAVARQFDLHLTNLGYGGNEHLEISVARMIRDRPADLLTLCVGGNIWGSRTLTARTYRAAVIGFVQTLRDRHPTAPIAVVTFIHSMHDVEPQTDGMITLQQVRELTAQAVDDLRAFGDERIFCIDGRDLFGPADMPLMSPDRVHPGGDGQLLMAQRFIERVMPRMLALRDAR